jgi:hypothetical protein
MKKIKIKEWFYEKNLYGFYPHAKPERGFTEQQIEKETEKAVFAHLWFWANGTISFQKGVWLPKSVLEEVEEDDN